MTKRIERPTNKVNPKKDRAWFERKIAELKAELDRLPEDRQAELKRKLAEDAEQ